MGHFIEKQFKDVHYIDIKIIEIECFIDRADLSWTGNFKDIKHSFIDSLRFYVSQL